MKANNNYIYILECADGSLYTGWTTNLEQRLAAHNNGSGAKYTKGRRPVKLVYFEEYPDSRIARQREWAIKQLTRPAKMMLIAKGGI